jgi:hypothetical protein
VLPAGDYYRLESVHKMVESAVLTMRREMESWEPAVNLKMKEVGMSLHLTLAIGITFLNSRTRSTERVTEQFINDAERR